MKVLEKSIKNRQEAFIKAAKLIHDLDITEDEMNEDYVQDDLDMSEAYHRIRMGQENSFVVPEKPDFEKLAVESTEYCNDGEHSHDCGCGAFVDGCEKIWDNYVELLKSEITKLKEQIAFYADQNQNQ